LRIFRSYKIRLLEECWRDLILIDELRHFERVSRWDAQMFNVLGLDGDVFAFAILVAFDDVRVLDGAIVGGDLLVTNALAGLAADLMEVNLALGLSCGKEFDSE
jgi:hypothetical protein